MACREPRPGGAPGRQFSCGQGHPSASQRVVDSLSLLSRPAIWTRVRRSSARSSQPSSSRRTRSRRVKPPHTPYGSRCDNACAAHCARTGHRRHRALARCGGPWSRRRPLHLPRELGRVPDPAGAEQSPVHGADDGPGPPIHLGHLGLPFRVREAVVSSKSRLRSARSRPTNGGSRWSVLARGEGHINPDGGTSTLGANTSGPGPVHRRDLTCEQVRSRRR